MSSDVTDEMLAEAVRRMNAIQRMEMVIGGNARKYVKNITDWATKDEVKVIKIPR